jgi:uncharacterized protein YjiS (DUF1127 family)
LMSRAGIVPKHASDTFSPTTTLREKSMSVAKHLSYAGSRSRKQRPRRIDGPSFAYLSTHHDEAPRARPQQAPSRQPEIAGAPIASWSVLRTTVQFAEAAAELVWAVASWLVMEMLDGCAAHAMAMYGIPEDADAKECDDATPATTPVPPTNWSRPTLHVISVNADIGAGEIFSPPDATQPCAISAARSGQMRGSRAGWRTAIVTSAVWLLSKIREGYARRRDIAELQNMDDRSLRDIGISRADISYIARHGARPE